MRKVDYTSLAGIIKQNVALADAKDTLHTSEYWTGYKAVLTIVAYEFANVASVKKDDFMRACGLR